MKKKIKKLLRRAGMDNFGLNTKVVTASDVDGGYIMVTPYLGEGPWGDTLSISFRHKDERLWYPFNFSPARARIIAHHILAQADVLEEQNGLEGIDNYDN